MFYQPEEMAHDLKARQERMQNTVATSLAPVSFRAFEEKMVVRAAAKRRSDAATREGEGTGSA